MEIVGFGCLESYLCAQVYLQNVSAMMELLVGDDVRPRRRLTRRGSKGLSAFVFLWMGLTVVMLVTRDTSVTSCTALLPLVETDVEVALVGLLAALRTFDVYFGFVQLVYILRKCGVDKRNKKLLRCGLQRCFVNVWYETSCLKLLSDLVCRFTFGD